MKARSTICPTSYYISSTMGNSPSKAILLACILATAANSHGAVSARTSDSVAFVGKTLTSRSFLSLRGGDDDENASAAASSDTSDLGAPASTSNEEPSLDEKVYAAMKKLGMNPPSSVPEGEEDCKDGVCAIPEQLQEQPQKSSTPPAVVTVNPYELASKIAKELHVDDRLAMAAIGATSSFGESNNRVYNEQAAKDMIQQELDLIAQIPADAPDVEQLVSEGFDSFMSRRALAFAEQNMDDARAILIADQMDEEEERQQEEDDEEEEQARAQLRAEQQAQKPDFVEVKSNYDPTAIQSAAATPKAQPAAQQQQMPKPADKKNVVFEATTAQIQELVLESPVPVLLDIYADWCGPCKALTPALEEMAIKSGGVFRLVKVNTDKERPVTGALEVTSLPTVYGVRDGKIVHMFQGMPRDETMMKNFMMGLFGAAPFTPRVTDEETEKYKELSAKLVKTAGAASFSFSARERLTDRIQTKLDELVADDSVADVEGSASLLRTLLNNAITDPYDPKYRKINLTNQRIASKIGGNSACLAILKNVGFSKSAGGLTIGKGKKIINVAPLVCARDTIEKWIQKNRAEMAAAARKRKDELDRVTVQAEIEARGDDEEIEQEEEEAVDPTACNLKLRLDGKKKVHDIIMLQDDPLSKVLEALSIDAGEEEYQITCVAKRLVVKSSDKQAMKKTLGEHGLMPKAAIVVKVGGGEKADATSLKDRAAKKSLKKGSHTMQSIGVYAKDDNNKGELIDGGGGVMYEQDVTDDEEEGAEQAAGDKSVEESADEENTPNERDEE
jgi:thioredoxin-like negative regulator of GroEL